MKAVGRESILDLQRYEEQRDEIRERIFAVKAARRVHLGDHLTFLFENEDTVRYQVQEMCRAERLWKDQDVERELRTYNALLGGDGELGCTLLIEITEAAERGPRLVAWRELPEHLYARLEDGSRVKARFDEDQRDDERLSAVQFLRFETRGAVPVALGSDFGPLSGEVALTPDQRDALAQDLR
jgi:Protein of unknown function (DUF3501)